MTREQNARLARVIRLLSMEDHENIDIKTICRRIAGIIGVNGVLSLFNKTTDKYSKLKSLLDGVLLATSIPCLREITGQKELSWTLGLAIGLLRLNRNVPTWFVSYFFIEAVVDEVKLWIRYDAVNEKHWIRLRQVITSILIPIFYGRSLSRGRLHWILFGKRSIWKDFFLLFAAWNTAKTYQTLKRLLMKEKKGNVNERRSSMVLTETSNRANVHQGTMTQLLMRRLDELNELSAKGSRTPLIERVYGFFFGDQLFKCVKWTIWRQMLGSVFNGRHAKCLRPFHKAIIIMLTFVFLDGGDPLNINWALLKYLSRSTLSQELARIPKCQKALLFTSLNLSYYRAPVITCDK